MVIVIHYRRPFGDGSKSSFEGHFEPIEPSPRGHRTVPEGSESPTACLPWGFSVRGVLRWR